MIVEFKKSSRIGPCDDEGNGGIIRDPHFPYSPVKADLSKRALAAVGLETTKRETRSTTYDEGSPAHPAVPEPRPEDVDVPCDYN